MKDLLSIDAEIKAAEEELADLDVKRAVLKKKIQQLKKIKHSVSDNRSYIPQTFPVKVTSESPEKEKISLFRALFRGREDVFPRHFESAKSGKSGYQPECLNQWIRGLCRKPAVKCSDCDARDFIPISDEIIFNHLMGRDMSKRSAKDFTIGVYPLLTDETCWFLAVDFDKESWMADSKAYMETCRHFNVPAVIERSRSGHGGHIWIFFSEPIPARLARQVGAFMMTQAMEKRPEIGFESYDRFFPSQDTMPKGGFGSLIALPLQKKPREKGNSVFIDEKFNPYPDQWAFFSSIRRMTLREVENVVEQAPFRGGVLGVKYVGTDDDLEPWKLPPSGRKPDIPIEGQLPEEIEIVLGNQIYIHKEGLPPSLQNRLIRLAAFQNPEFYKAQAMRFPTFDKPRIIHCCEDFPKYIGLPRGCLEDAVDLLQALNIRVKIHDERFNGTPINFQFSGTLRPEQKAAADSMLAHDIGVLSASTAFGKTVIAAYLIAKRSVNTLVVVHRKQLLDQWIARLSNFLDISQENIGQIGSGKHQPKGLIDVAMIQSLSRKGVVDDIVADYGHLLVDECHHVSARSFEIVARRSKAKYVTGLSATVIRKDGHHPIIFMNCGPVRYRVDDKKQAAKRPFAHKVIVRKTAFRIPHSFDAESYASIHEIYAALVDNEERNQMIVEDIMDAVSNDRFPVILTERREHLEKLKTLLEGKIQNMIVMKGGMGKKQRQEALKALENLPYNEGKAILATGRYLGEGFDDSRLDTLFLTMPISWRGTLAQYAGRLHRTHDMKKEVLIYDYADLNVPMLIRMYERRVKGYRSIGYEITAVLRS
ncbi:MAG: DEAD/DEAH box helicase family protein [Pseudomonadota bacterium]